jgi:hypothetical protein
MISRTETVETMYSGQQPGTAALAGGDNNGMSKSFSKRLKSCFVGSQKQDDGRMLKIITRDEGRGLEMLKINREMRAYTPEHAALTAHQT